MFSNSQFRTLGLYFPNFWMTFLEPPLSLSHPSEMELLTASLDEEFIELVNATLGRWTPFDALLAPFSSF
jgi:hypothetical protein